MKPHDDYTKSIHALTKTALQVNVGLSATDYNDAYGPGSIVSARGLRMRESMNHMKYTFRAEIQPPADWEADYRAIWTPPSREFTDKGALALWVDQMFLDNPQYTRDQVVIYEITYTKIA